MTTDNEDATTQYDANNPFDVFLKDSIPAESVAVAIRQPNGMESGVVIPSTAEKLMNLAAEIDRVGATFKDYTTPSTYCKAASSRLREAVGAVLAGEGVK